jgi:hypothetical protein
MRTCCFCDRFCDGGAQVGTGIKSPSSECKAATAKCDQNTRNAEQESSGANGKWHPALLAPSVATKGACYKSSGLPSGEKRTQLTALVCLQCAVCEKKLGDKNKHMPVFDTPRYDAAPAPRPKPSHTARRASLAKCAFDKQQANYWRGRHFVPTRAVVLTCCSARSKM